MNILLGVTGCIAAYKAAEVVRGLQQGGAQVRVIMTGHAANFVQPLTFEALSGQPVIVGMFERPHYAAIEHISVARDANLLLVAPATANIIAKFAHGIADDFLTSVYLSNTNPVLVAPAMNVEMWNHVATQANLDILRKRGVLFVDPGEGYQACGEVGMGRLAEPDEIVRRALELCVKIQSRTRDFQGEYVLVTAGPTVEYIDPVRFISNRSSGRMGYAMAEAARARGARVTLISGPVKLSPPQGIETVNVRTTREMYEAVSNRLTDTTVFIGCAAVSDFRPATPAGQKIKKEGRKRLTIELESTEDIIESVGMYRKDRLRIVAGFAAESESLLENAETKLRQKGLDLIVANDISLKDRGFDVETNKATIIRRDGSRLETPLLEKRELADLILDQIAGILYGRQE